MKDELMREFWPDAIVEENNITVSMSILRKALGVITIYGSLSKQCRGEDTGSSPK